MSGLYSRPGRSGGGKEVWRRGWVELEAFDALRRLYDGGWPGTVIEGRFFGSANCGPPGGGEVALPGGLLAMMRLQYERGGCVWTRLGDLWMGQDGLRIVHAARPMWMALGPKWTNFTHLHADNHVRPC